MNFDEHLNPRQLPADQSVHRHALLGSFHRELRSESAALAMLLGGDAYRDSGSGAPSFAS